MVTEVVTGKVVRYDEFKGYGFITPDRGPEDVFVHVNDLEMDKNLLAPGVRVKFVVGEGERGLKASHVVLADSDERPEDAGTGVQPAEPRVPSEVHTAEPDGSRCDVLAYDEFAHEVTEVLLESVPTLAAGNLLKVRDAVLNLALSHRWIQSSGRPFA